MSFEKSASCFKSVAISNSNPNAKIVSFNSPSSKNRGGSFSVGGGWSQGGGASVDGRFTITW
jgi:hypothetical protein